MSKYRFFLSFRLCCVFNFSLSLSSWTALQAHVVRMCPKVNCHNKEFCVFFPSPKQIFAYRKVRLTQSLSCPSLFAINNPSTRNTSAAARLLRMWVRIPPGEWMSVCYECCVLPGRGLCDRLITHPEESYRVWCGVVCDLETSWMRRPLPTGDCYTKKKKSKFHRQEI